MKRYQEYMDGIQAPEGLHERLLGLDAPKKTVRWQRYGTMAAALAVAIGLGAFGLSRLPEWNAVFHGVEIGNIDIAPAGPGTDIDGDGQTQTGGGYEVANDGSTYYCMLPAVVYNEPAGPGLADYSLAPPDALSRQAGLDDVKALLGDADMAAHLLWTDDLEWSGTLWFGADGSASAAALSAEGDGVKLYIEMMASSEVPSCVIFPDDRYETTTFDGVEITALKNSGYTVANGVELRESRELSCFADNVGYKLTIYGADGEQVENMCARFARWAIVEGFDLAALSSDGAEPWMS